MMITVSPFYYANPCLTNVYSPQINLVRINVKLLSIRLLLNVVAKEKNYQLSKELSIKKVQIKERSSGLVVKVKEKVVDFSNGVKTEEEGEGEGEQVNRILERDLMIAM